MQHHRNILFFFSRHFKDFKQQLKNLTNNVSTLEQQLKNTLEKQLKLHSELKNHGHGNKKRIEDLKFKLTTRLNSTEEQIKALTRNITNEIATLESQAYKNLPSDISKVSSILYNILYNILSSEVITIEKDAQNAFLGLIGSLKPLGSSEAIEKSLFALENALKLTSSTFFGTESIGLWDMGGKYPARKVKNMSFSCHQPFFK